MSKIKFYKENKTDTVIASIEKLDKNKYTELKPNTSKADKEKHIPVYIVSNDRIKVNIGSTPHPMEEDHYIAWIAMVDKEQINKVDLYPKEKPTATFRYVKNSKVYAYCNKHGLWMTEIK